MVGTLCWYCGAEAAHHGMCYMHSVHFNGAENAAKFQAEHNAAELAKKAEVPE